MSLIGTSDLHGHVEGVTFTVPDAAGTPREVQRGGLPLFAGYMTNLRRQHPALLLDGGDLFQGTLTSNLGEGQGVIEAYNLIGYTAAAIGNHEFDYGPVGPRAVPRTGSDDDPTGALKARIAAARFPFLSVNVHDEATGKPVTWPNTYPSRLIPVPGAPDIRIGVIGGTAEDTPRTTNALNLRGLVIDKVVPGAREQARALRQQGAAAVVLVVHEGADCKRFDDPRDLSSCSNVDERVLGMAAQLAGEVDAIVGGHSHAGVAHFVGKVPVVQSYMGGRAFGRIDLHFRRAAGTVALQPERTQIFPPTEVCSVAPRPRTGPPPMPKGPGTALPPEGPRTAARPLCEKDTLGGTALTPVEYEGQKVVQDPAVAAALAPHIARAVAVRGEKIGVTLKDRLGRNFRNESSIGTVLADLIREGAELTSGTKVDVGFQNGGGVRADLPVGELTYGDLYEVLPFDNRLAILRLPGKALVELMRANLLASSGVLNPSGLQVEARCQGADLLVNLLDGAGRPIQPERVYTVATSDFLAAGGDNFGAVVRGLPAAAVTYYDDAPPLRDIVLRAMRRHPQLGLPERPVARLRLPMSRPVRCAAAP